MRFYLSLILLFISFSLTAQDKITGIVTDKADGSALSGVSARMVDSSGKVKRFAVTRADGVFRIAVGDDREGLTLQIARLGYRTESLGLDTVDLGDTLRVRLDINAVALKEVGVKAKRIREQGDTVTYTVGQFARKQDRSIADVMNRMPGLEVDRRGKVQYQGTDINRLYVEGTDLAGGRYGVITGNLQAEDVGAVEVLENHQPLQVLRGLSFSDQAAINLRLKRKSKTKLMAYGDIGGGYGERAGGLYTGDLFLMTVKGAIQNITSVKVNNIGSPLGTISGFFGDDGERLGRYISIGSVGGNGRSLFNRSASSSTSSTWKNRRGGQWRMQADYGYDHLWADRNTMTTYYLESGDKVITEERHADSREHLVSFVLNYELNEKRYYLSDNLSFEGAWADTRIGISGTMPNNQKSRSDSYNLANRLKIIRRFGSNRIVTFNSIIQWLSRPEKLWVSTGADSTVRNYGSDVGQHAFFTDERASLGFIIGKAVVSMEGGVSAFLRHLDTSMSGEPLSVSSDTGNDLSTDYVRVYVRPKLELNLRRVSINFNVPLNYYSYFFSGAIGNRNQLFAAPKLVVQWKPVVRHTFTLDASARRTPASLSAIHSGVVLVDYRTFNAGIDDYYSTTGQSVGTRWEWRDARRGWFATASATQSWADSKYGTAQDVVGDFVVNSYRRSPSSSESTQLRGRVQKSLDALSATVSLDGAFSRGTGRYFSQGIEVDRSLVSASVAPSLDMVITGWLNGCYRFAYSRDRMKLSGIDSSRNRSFVHNFGLSATPGRWIVSVNGNHTRTMLPTGRYDNVTDLGVRASFRMSKKLELTLDAINLLDSRYRIDRRFDDITSYESISYQRGREFTLSLRISR